MYKRTLHSFLGLKCQLTTLIKYDDQIWRSVSATDTQTVDVVSSMSPEKFSPFFLTQNCQQTDIVLKEMLGRIRLGNVREDDMLLLES